MEGNDGNVCQNTGSGWQKYNNSTNSWSNVNTQQAQQQAHQQAQSYGSSTPTPRPTYSNTNKGLSHRPWGWSAQKLNSEMPNRQRGAAPAPNGQRGGAAGGWGDGGRNW